MDIKTLGAGSIVVTANKAKFVIDPPKSSIRKVSLDKDAVVLKTNRHSTLEDVAERFVIDLPGEYEINSMAIRGIQTSAYTQVHDEEPDSNVVYTLRTLSLNLCIVGHPAAKLSENVLEEIGNVDILVVPVGGGGFTLDAEAAAKVVKAIDPAVVVPVHYEQKGTTYEVPQDALDKFLEEIGGTVHKEDTLKLKQVPSAENLEVYVLST